MAEVNADLILVRWNLSSNPPPIGVDWACFVTKCKRIWVKQDWEYVFASKQPEANS
jgi:hypothetical protein